MSPRYEWIIDGHGIAGIATYDRFNTGEEDSRSLRGPATATNLASIGRLSYPKNCENFGNLGGRPAITETDPKTAPCRTRAARRVNNFVHLHQCCSLLETSPTELLGSH